MQRKINILEKINKFLKFTRKCQDISVEELNELLIEEDVLLIDVRSQQEYKENHMDGAISIPNYEIGERIKSIEDNKNRVIVLYCKSGIRSKKAQKILIDLGYINVYNLRGGVDAN